MVTLREHCLVYCGTFDRSMAEISPILNRLSQSAQQIHRTAIFTGPTGRSGRVETQVPPSARLRRRRSSSPGDAGTAGSSRGAEAVHHPPVPTELLTTFNWRSLKFVIKHCRLLICLITKRFSSKTALYVSRYQLFNTMRILRSSGVARNFDWGGGGSKILMLF